MELVASAALGIGLAAAAGLRVFIPLLVLNLASRLDMVSLTPGLEWVGSWGAFTVFAVAAVVEIVGFLVPVVDNVLDVIATPAAAVAGAIVMGAVLVGVDPLWTWALAIIAGGGTAAVVQGTTTAVRATSTATTAGVANPLVGASESAGSIGLSILAIAVPILAAALVVFILTYLMVKAPKIVARVFRSSSGRGDIQGADS
jgi:hypothetical protein